MRVLSKPDALSARRGQVRRIEIPRCEDAVPEVRAGTNMHGLVMKLIVQPNEESSQWLRQSSTPIGRHSHLSSTTEK